MQKSQSQNAIVGLAQDRFWNPQRKLTSCLFIFLFLDMMLNPEHDTLKLRNCVWISYLVGLIIIPIVITALGILGFAFDYAKIGCMQAQKEMENQNPP